MPKYKVDMIMSCSKSAQFVMQADDPDHLHDLLGNMDSSFIEDNLEWSIVDLSYPSIEQYEKVHKDTPVHPQIQKEAQTIQKAWEAL